MAILHVGLWSVENRLDAEKLIEFMRSVSANAKKDGMPYIITSEAGYNLGPRPDGRIRSQGYNVSTVLRFKNYDDLMYWGMVDPVHDELLRIIEGISAKPPIVMPFECGAGEFKTPQECGLYNST